MTVSEKLDNLVSARFSDQEKIEVTIAAQAAGMTTSAYVRARVLGTPIRYRPVLAASALLIAESHRLVSVAEGEEVDAGAVREIARRVIAIRG
jgi:hypothetical protein